MAASPIFVPNVIIGTDANLVVDIMGVGATISDLRSNPALWLFPGDGTSNLLSMEHDVLGNADDYRITLTFVDPTEVFEHRIVDTTFTGQMDNTFGFIWNLSKLAGADLKKSNEQGFIEDMGDWGGLPPGAVEILEKDYPYKAPTTQYIGPTMGAQQWAPTKWEDVVPKLNDQVSKHILKQLIDALFGAKGLSTWFKNKTRLVSAKKLIITYGLGPDLGSWSGPFICEPTGVDYNYTADGVRTISVTLVPVGTSLGMKLPIESLGYVGAVIGESLPIVNKKEIIENDLANQFEPRMTRGAALLPDLVKIQNYAVPGVDYAVRDFNLTFGSMIQNYMSAALGGKKNILILLPNMNEVFGTVLDREISDPRNIKQKKTFDEPFGNVIRRMGERGSGQPIQLQGHSLKNDPSRHETEECYYVRGNKNGDKNLKFGPGGNDDTYMLWTLVMSNLGFSDNKQPVVDFLAQINALSAKDFEWDYFEEMNATIIKILYNVGLIPDEDDPVVIVGDSKIIQRLLYPSGSDLQLNSNSPVLPEYAPGLPPAILGKWVAYREKYKEWRMSKVDHSTSPLLGASPAIDEFAVDASGWDFIKELEPNLAIAMRDMPVFKSGGRTPNILSIKLTTDNQYFKALQSGWTMAAFSHVLAASHQALNENDAVYKHLDEIVTRVSDLIPGTDDLKVIQAILEEEGVHDIGSPTQELIAETILRLFENAGNITKGNTGNLLYTREHELNNPINPFLTIYKRWFNSAVRLEIETLPMFHLSDVLWLKKPCLVLIEEPGMTGLPPHKASTMRRSLAGAYTIIGFNHIVSDDEVKSKFVLRKIPGFSADEWGAPEVVTSMSGFQKAQEEWMELYPGEDPRLMPAFDNDGNIMNWHK